MNWKLQLNSGLTYPIQKIYIKIVHFSEILSMTYLELTITLSTGALAWNADQLSSGSRDRMILQRDVRTPSLQSERRLQGHRQEVCGLKWSTDHQLLASGGNDNKVKLFLLNLLLSLRIYSLCSLMRIWFVISAAGLEPLLTESCADIHGSSGCSESHCLVPSPAWSSGLWRWNCGSLYSILEHSDITAAPVYGHRFSGLQPSMVQTC